MQLNEARWRTHRVRRAAHANDLANANNIEERSGKTRQAVALWVRGERGDGFPPQKTKAGDAPTWLKVAQWLLTRSEVSSKTVEDRPPSWRSTQCWRARSPKPRGNVRLGGAFFYSSHCGGVRSVASTWERRSWLMSRKRSSSRYDSTKDQIEVQVSHWETLDWDRAFSLSPEAATAQLIAARKEQEHFAGRLAEHMPDEVPRALRSPLARFFAGVGEK